MRFLTALIAIAVLASVTPCDAGNAEITAELRAAQLLDKQGHPARALAEYKQICKANPNYFEAWSFCGKACYNIGEYTQARKYLETARTLRPNDPKCLRALGETLLALQKPDEAVDVLQEALKAGPHLYPTYARFLQAIQEKDGDEGAEKAIKRFLVDGDEKKNAAPIVGCGVFYQDQHKHTKAIECFQRALATNPRYAPAYIALANSYDQRGLSDKAVEAMTSGIEYSSNPDEDYIKLAMLYSKYKKPNKALACLDKVAAIDPEKTGTVLSSKALVLYMAGKPSESLEMAKQAIAAGADTCESYLYCVICLQELKRDHEAKAYLDQAIASAQTAKDHRSCGEKLVNMGESVRALAFFDKAIRLEPRHPSGYLKRGTTYASLGKRDAAIADFSKAIQLDKKNADAHKARAQLYTEAKRNDEARNDMTIALALERNPNALIRLADAEKQVGRFDSASRILQKATSINPDDVSVRKKAARRFEEMKEYEKAIEEYTECIKRAPNDASALLRRGNAYGNIGKDIEKLVNLTESIRLQPTARAYESRANFYFDHGRFLNCIDDCTSGLAFADSKSRGLLIRRANAYKDRREFQRAIDDCTNAIKAEPKNSSSYSLRANLYSKTKRPELAIKDMNNAIALDKNNSDFYFSRGKMFEEIKNFAKAAEDFQTALKIENYPRYEQALLEVNKKLAQ